MASMQGFLKVSSIGNSAIFSCVARQPTRQPYKTGTLQWSVAILERSRSAIAL